MVGTSFALGEALLMRLMTMDSQATPSLLGSNLVKLRSSGKAILQLYQVPVFMRFLPKVGLFHWVSSLGQTIPTFKRLTSEINTLGPRLSIETPGTLYEANSISCFLKKYKLWQRLVASCTASPLSWLWIILTAQVEGKVRCENLQVVMRSWAIAMLYADNESLTQASYQGKAEECQHGDCIARTESMLKPLNS